jgi:hypothetical protein
MKALVSRYDAAVVEEQELSPEKRIVANVGKMDAKKHLAANVTSVMSSNINQVGQQWAWREEQMWAPAAVWWRDGPVVGVAGCVMVPGSRPCIDCVFSRAVASSQCVYSQDPACITCVARLCGAQTGQCCRVLKQGIACSAVCLLT